LRSDDPALKRVLDAAALAHLEVSEAEAAALAPELDAILEAFQGLRGVAVAGVEPLLHGPSPPYPYAPADATREDEPRASDGSASLLARAPEVQEDCYRLPRAFPPPDE